MREENLWPLKVIGLATVTLFYRLSFSPSCIRCVVQNGLVFFVRCFLSGVCWAFCVFVSQFFPWALVPPTDTNRILGQEGNTPPSFALFCPHVSRSPRPNPLSQAEILIRNSINLSVPFVFRHTELLADFIIL